MFVMNHMEANILNEESPNLERNFLIKRYILVWAGVRLLLYYLYNLL